jgi:hypothetical protein
MRNPSPIAKDRSGCLKTKFCDDHIERLDHMSSANVPDREASLRKR